MIPFFFQDGLTDLSFYFSPPIREYTPPWANDTPKEHRPFLGHFRGAPRAVNVYQLLDGSFSEAEGMRPEEYVRVFRGGTLTPVDDETADLLQASGYVVDYA